METFWKEILLRKKEHSVWLSLCDGKTSKRRHLAKVSDVGLEFEFKKEVKVGVQDEQTGELKSLEYMEFLRLGR